MMKDNELGYV